MKAKPFQRILVGIDEGHTCVNAIDLAARLAEAFSSSVMLVHVIKTPNMLSPELLAALPTVKNALNDCAEQLLRSVSHRLPALVPTLHVIKEGNAAAKLLEAADEWQADLIVLGTRGRGHGAHAGGGSTSEVVIHRATCPVLIGCELCRATRTYSAHDDEHYTLEAYAQ